MDRFIIIFLTIAFTGCENNSYTLEDCNSFISTGIEDLAEKACTQYATDDNPELQSKLGSMFIIKSSKEKADIEKGLYWLNKAANNGHLGTFAFLGLHYTYTQEMHDINKAIYWHERGVEAGNALCAINLGRIYYEGLYTTKNLEKAKYYLSLLNKPDAYSIELLNEIEKQLHNKRL